MTLKSGIYGIKEVTKLIEEVKKVPAKVITRATKKSARIALDQAKRNCPESIDGSHGKPPGTLRRSLKIKAEKRRKGKAVYQVGPDKDGWYAHLVDYGFTDKAGVKWEGNKFLRDSVDDNRNTMSETILDEIGKGIDKLK